MTGSLDSDDGGQQLLLGKMLLERGLITPDQLREALVERARHVSTGEHQATPLGGILVRKGYLSDSQLLGILAEQGGGGSPSPVSSEGTDRSPATSYSGPSLPAVTVADPMNEGGRLGKYQLLRELGRGGMGVVYDALDSQLNRRVALKLMLANPNADPKDRALEEERFVQEAQLSAKLKHGNIVTVYEAGLLEGRQFLAMELIEGDAFNDWRKTATFREQVQVIRDVSQAVHHAHEQGILHRDIKPRNILIGGGSHPYVTDFGLAKSLGKNVHHSLTGSGAVVGTPAYMSPEQAQGLDRVDWRTDIYSLGVILYECMTGRTPFIGESPIEILMKVVKDPVIPPLQVVESSRAVGLDKGIESICLKALAKKDRDRYVTSQAFADDLTKWLSGQAVKVHVAKTRSPHRKLYVVTALVFGSLAGLMVAGAWWINRPNASEDLETARRFMNAADYDQAHLYFRVALTKEPRNAEAQAGVEEADRKRKQRSDDHKSDLQLQVELATRKAKELSEDALRKLQDEALASDADRVHKAREARLAQEEAEKAQLAVAHAEQRLRHWLGPEKPGSTPSPNDEWAKSARLLLLVAPKRHALRGMWEMPDEKLTSDRSRQALIELPFQMPTEYDFRMEFTRETGAGGVCAVLSRGGQLFRIEVGGDRNTRSCIEILGEDGAVRTPAVRTSTAVLQNDRDYTLVVKVRAAAVTAALDGEEILSWKTDAKSFSVPSAWRLRNTRLLGVGSDGSRTSFSRLNVREVQGIGSILVTAPVVPNFKALAPTPANLRPGLVAEYFLGVDFESVAHRRIDKTLDFSWGTGSAWSGGPADFFSCRWTGLLHVPRNGQYQFEAPSEDRLRLVIDGIQVLGGWSSRLETTRTAQVGLDEGYHRFLLEYSHSAHLAGVSLAWTPAGAGPPSSVGSKSFFHEGADPPVYLLQRIPELAGQLAGHTNNVNVVAYQRQDRLLLSASEDRKVRFWEAAGKRESGVPATHPTSVQGLSIAPDGRAFVTGGRDGLVRIWDLQNRTPSNTLEGHQEHVSSVAWDPTGKLVASGSNDRTIRLWDPSQPQAPAVVLEGHTAGVECVVFSPDGRRLASGSRDGSVRLWDPATGKVVRILPAHADYVASVAWSPDGTRLASAGWDGLLRVWIEAKGDLVHNLGDGVIEYSCVTWSPDGKTLISGGKDGMIRLWNAATGDPLRAIPAHAGEVTSIAFASDGRTFASCSTDLLVRIWTFLP